MAVKDGLPATDFSRKDREWVKNVVDGTTVPDGLPATDLSRMNREWVKAVVDEAGGGGGDITVEALSVTENNTYTAPEGKAYSPVTVNVPVDVNVNTLTFDFTKNKLTDEETGFFAFSLLGANVSLSASGITVSGASSYARLENINLENKVVTVFMGTVDSSITTGHQRMIMLNAAYDRGLVMQNSTTWKFYNGAWVGDYGSDKNQYSGKKLTFEFDDAGKMNFYVDDVLTGENISMTPSAIGLASSTTGLYSATYEKVVIQTREQAILDGLLGGA